MKTLRRENIGAARAGWSKAVPTFPQSVLVVATIFLFSSCSPAYASTPEYFNKITDAIYLAEGGKLAKKPFGILSVPCSGYSGCRKIAYNTVRNNYRRWESAGRHGDYLEFLASKYAPVGASNDPTNLNRHWLKNVRKLVANSARTQ